MPISKSVICPVLIGRSTVLEPLEQLIFSADDAPRLVLLSGEAGIGKSRLAAEIRSRAAARGWGILQGHCYETDSALPYAPLLDLLRGIYAASPEPEITRAFGAAAPELLKLLPELSRYFPDVAPSPVLEAESEKRRLFHALALLLLGRMDDRPGLIVVEDLHWSDETSLDFLLHLARQLSARESPGFMVFTYRSEEGSPKLAHFLAALDREHLAAEYPLSPLSRAEVETLLRVVFNQERPVRMEFVDTIHSLTEGNPFFIEEVLKSLLLAGDIYYVEPEGIWDRKPIRELHIPRTVQDALHRRTEQLSETARSILTLAAVAGRRFDFTLLQQLAASQGQLDEGQLLAVIKEWISAQLVVEETPDHFSFRHALTRQAIYSQLLRRERRALHQQVARLLEQMYSDGARLDAHVEELAYHFYEAGEWHKAIHYARQAGEKALRLYAPHLAVQQFTRALDAAREASIEAPVDILLARGQAYEGLDDFERPRADYETALESARSQGDRSLEWRALLALGSLWAGRDFRRGGEYFRRAEEAARLLDDPATLAHTLNRVGNWHLNMGRAFGALSYHEQALRYFEELRDTAGRAQTLDLLGITNYVCGNLVHGTTCYEESRRLFGELGDRQGMINSMTYLSVRGWFNAEVLDVPTVTELIAPGEAALQMARDIHWRSAEAIVSSCLAKSYGTIGEYGRALKLAEEAVDLAQEAHHPEWMSSARWALGHLYYEVLALDEAQKQLEEALARARESSSVLYVEDVIASLVLTLIAQKKIEQAVEVLTGVPDHGEAGETWGLRLCRSAEAELALASGQPARALGIADHLIASAANIGTYGSHAVPRLSRIRGLALQGLDRLPEAEMELEAARDVARSQGRANLLWRINLDLGKLYLSQNRAEAAQRELAEGKSLVEKLAGTLADEGLRLSFLERALGQFPSIKSPSPREAARREFDGLTEREREVAALVALGRSNREIAHTLVVSERTAATHVSNILTKLSFSSRAQIAAWAVEHGLPAARPD